MRYQRIAYGTTQDAVWITLARPHTLNLISTEVFVELADAVVHARSDRTRDVIVLGATGSVFSAGGDLASGISAQVAQGPSPELASEMYRHVHDDYLAFDAIENCPKTIICALNGPAYGAGAVLALLCDLVVATTNASLSFAPGRWGIVDAPSAARLGHHVGLRAAKDLLFTGRSITAEEAYQRGLINQVVPADRLLAQVVAYIEAVRSVAPGVRASLKELLHEELPPMRVDSHYQSAVGPEFFDGVAAFGARRPAPWTAEADRLRQTETRLTGEAEARARQEWEAEERARKAARRNGIVGDGQPRPSMPATTTNP